MRYIIRIIILLISLILAVYVYNLFYSVDLERNLTEKLSTSLNEEVTILGIYDIMDDKLVRFDFKDQTGHAILTKGLQDQYRIGDVYKEVKKGPVYFAQYKKEKNYLVVETSLAFESLRINTTQEPIIYGKNETGLFDVIMTPLSKVSLKDYQLQGKEIYSVELDYGSQYHIDSRGYTNNGPDSIVYVTCGLIILAGYIITLLFTRKNNWFERLYFKMTKSHPQPEDGDPNDYTLMT